MKRILIACSALALVAAPASAQLLGGGGGLGGALGGGGGIGGGLGGGIPSLPTTSDLPSFPSRAASGAIDGAATGSAHGNGSAHVDRHNGHVDASGHGNASGNGNLTGALDTPAASGAGNGRAHGSASGGGSASANLVGTDAVNGATQGAVSQARGTNRRVWETTRQGWNATQPARGTAWGLVHSARPTASNVAGRAAGAVGGSAGYANGALAAAGSAAAAGQGAFSVEKGMNVLNSAGGKIGRVRQVIANSRGQVQQLLVKVRGEQAMLPASNFSAAGNGNAVVSAMGEGTIGQIAQQQKRSGQ